MDNVEGATVDQLLQLELAKAKIQADKEIELRKIDADKEIELRKINADKEIAKINADKDVRLRKIDKEAELDNPRELPCPVVVCQINFVDSKLAYSAQ